LSVLDYVPLPAFEDNYIWVLTDGRHAVVVDPGIAAPVKSYCERHGLVISAILLTHGHDDHVGGVADLLSNGPVIETVKVYGPMLESVPSVSVPVRQNATVRIESPRLSFEVMDAPGHTAGHIVYYQSSDSRGVPHLFCGDTLFASGCGRLLGGSPDQMLATLDKLARLPESTKVHCAHEYTLSNIRFSKRCDPENVAIDAWMEKAETLRAQGKPTVPTTIGHEKALNPFLRVGEPSVYKTVVREFALGKIDRLQIFTVLRRWKDRFQ
jgi:hydroxyacylglutathione hydrolase